MEVVPLTPTLLLFSELDARSSKAPRPNGHATGDPLHMADDAKDAAAAQSDAKPKLAVTQDKLAPSQRQLTQQLLLTSSTQAPRAHQLRRAENDTAHEAFLADADSAYRLFEGLQLAAAGNPPPGRRPASLDTKPFSSDQNPAVPPARARLSPKRRASDALAAQSDGTEAPPVAAPPLIGPANPGFYRSGTSDSLEGGSGSSSASSVVSWTPGEEEHAAPPSHKRPRLKRRDASSVPTPWQPGEREATMRFMQDVQAKIQRGRAEAAAAAAAAARERSAPQ